MKDLKGNIQKNNMKKLVISAVLGMFCYCTNNAAAPKKNKNIDKVLTIMLEGQINIFNAKKGIINQGTKIFNTIKTTAGEKTKDKILNFIKNQFTEEQEQPDFQNTITTLKQYFHLENINENKTNFKKVKLTELFWSEKGVKGKIEEDDKPKIKNYFQAIIKAEKELSEAFKEYYEAKKEVKKEAQHEEILKEIMNDCCGEEEGDDSVTKFIVNLGKMELKEVNEEVKKLVLAIIGKRITLSNKKDQKEEDFINFLKQKIGEEKKIYPKVNLLKEEGWCSCCNDCCGKERKSVVLNKKLKK